MTMVTWWILAALATQAAAPVPRDAAVFDLTVPAQDPATMRMFSLSVPSHPVAGLTKRWPLRVTVLDAVSDSSDPDWIVLDVRIEALQTVSIPVARDRAAVDPEPRKSLPSFKEMHLRAKIDGTAIGYGATTPSERLSGSDLVPESLLTLQPGQSVRTRQRAWIGGVRKLAPPGAPPRVRALIHTYEDSASVSDLLSDNAVEIRTPPQ